MVTWIVVADASRGRLFASSEKGQPWKLLQELEHPDSRARNRDLESVEPGRQQQSFGAGHRPSMASPTEPKEVEAEHFAHELADKLAEGASRHAFSALALVAPPHFLGKLKKTLDEQSAKCVVATIDKDYTRSDLKELMARLDDAVHVNL
jgi:protein required for attachment to host cells